MAVVTVNDDVERPIDAVRSASSVDASAQPIGVPRRWIRAPMAKMAAVLVVFVVPVGLLMSWQRAPRSSLVDIAAAARQSIDVEAIKACLTNENATKNREEKPLDAVPWRLHRRCRGGVSKRHASHGAAPPVPEWTNESANCEWAKGPAAWYETTGVADIVRAMQRRRESRTERCHDGVDEDAPVTIVAFGDSTVRNLIGGVLSLFCDREIEEATRRVVGASSWLALPTENAARWGRRCTGVFVSTVAIPGLTTVAGFAGSPEERRARREHGDIGEALSVVVNRQEEGLGIGGGSGSGGTIGIKLRIVFLDVACRSPNNALWAVLDFFTKAQTSEGHRRLQRKQRGTAEKGGGDANENSAEQTRRREAEESSRSTLVGVFRRVDAIMLTGVFHCTESRVSRVSIDDNRVRHEPLAKATAEAVRRFAHTVVSTNAERASQDLRQWDSLESGVAPRDGGSNAGQSKFTGVVAPLLWIEPTQCYHTRCDAFLNDAAARVTQTIAGLDTIAVAPQRHISEQTAWVYPEPARCRGPQSQAADDRSSNSDASAAARRRREENEWCPFADDFHPSAVGGLVGCYGALVQSLLQSLAMEVERPLVCF